MLVVTRYPASWWTAARPQRPPFPRGSSARAAAPWRHLVARAPVRAGWRSRAGSPAHAFLIILARSGVFSNLQELSGLPELCCLLIGGHVSKSQSAILEGVPTCDLPVHQPVCWYYCDSQSRKCGDGRSWCCKIQPQGEKREQSL